MRPEAKLTRRWAKGDGARPMPAAPMAREATMCGKVKARRVSSRPYIVITPIAHRPTPIASLHYETDALFDRDSSSCSERGDRGASGPAWHRVLPGLQSICTTSPPPSCLFCTPCVNMWPLDQRHTSRPTESTTTKSYACPLGNVSSACLPPTLADVEREVHVVPCDGDVELGVDPGVYLGIRPF